MLHSNTTQTILETINREILLGSKSKNHPCHFMTLSYLNLDQQPENAIVVLRHYDPDTRQILFYTDWRSPKIMALKKNQHVTVLLYNPKSKNQIRAHCEAHVHHQDTMTEQQWRHTSKLGRLCYRQNIGPSNIIHSNENLNYNADDITAYANFSVISLPIKQIDFLHLNINQHQRFLLDVQKPIPTIKILAP